MRKQAEEAYGNLIEDIGNSKDISSKQKMLILESILLTLKEQNENLLYLECVNKMKEIDVNILLSQLER